MNIEIIGRHALLFDDDTTAAFVNSENALVEWNSLLIDRYDVRHLLSGPPPSRRRRHPQTSNSSSADAEIDHERYLDLPSPSDEQEQEEKQEPESVGGFNAIPFSYTNYEDSNNQKTAESKSEIPKFNPPFPVPDNLVHNLPPTEKVHQIIARTALFVSKNGGQSEIVLRVKQGDNPTFGFLMPDHHLHPYFRFLLNHQDLLQSKDSQHPENENKTSNTALSLLGSVYGTGEDDDTEIKHASSSSSSSSSSSPSKVSVSGKTVLPVGENKDNTFIIKKNSLSNTLKKGESSGSVSANFDKLLNKSVDKSRASSLPPILKTEHIIVDPTSEMKKLVDKIVEFIIKNGRQFEKVLMEQDRGHGRFPFLIPSNIFHPYYLKVLQKAQEPKSTVKNEKEDFRGYFANKKASILREKENYTVESDDIPFDSERKKKFKMVINKSRKDGSDLPPKTEQQQPEIQVDAAQAAAILQAATRGIKHPDLGFLLTNGQNEAGLTDEQKLKAERLKRAKMFVAQLKSGAGSSKAEPSRGLSAEPQVSLAKERERSLTPSDFDILDKRVKSENERLNEEKRAKRKYRARSSRDNEGESSETHDDVDEREEKRSHRHRKKKHRSRDRSLEDESEEKYVKRKHHKSSSRKKKHRSRSPYKDDEHENKHEYSRKKHRSLDEDSHDEVDSDGKSSRLNRKHRSHDENSHVEVDSDHKSSRRNRKHRSRYSSHDEVDSDRESSRRNRKHRSRKSSRHSKDRHKHKKGSNTEKDEIEDGEISPKLSGQPKGGLLGNGASREPSIDVSGQDQGPSVQPVEPTDVPDDLRAKIRAMLMSTM